MTGSKFLLRTDTAQVLIDAGLFRLKALRRRNWDSLGLPVPSLDAAVISHAHLDHCGYLPALVRQGFNGPVFMTADTAALAEIVLRDSAKLQEEDAKYASSRGLPKHSKPKPLYDLDDVERTLPLFRTVDFDASVAVADEIAVRLVPAGHILGSTLPVITVMGRTVVFSGDLGRRTIRCCVRRHRRLPQMRSSWSRPTGGPGCTCPTCRTTSRTRSPHGRPGRVGGDPVRGRPHRTAVVGPRRSAARRSDFLRCRFTWTAHGASGTAGCTATRWANRAVTCARICPRTSLRIATTQRIQQPNPRH